MGLAEYVRAVFQQADFGRSEQTKVAAHQPGINGRLRLKVPAVFIGVSAMPSKY